MVDQPTSKTLLCARLREAAAHQTVEPGDLREAADELERLRLENVALRNLAENLRPGPISAAMGGVAHEATFRAAVPPSREMLGAYIALAINDATLAALKGEEHLPKLTKSIRDLEEYVLRGSEPPNVTTSNLVVALELAKAALKHRVPGDCWATGPATGDPIEDLLVCPGCRALNSIEQALRQPEPPVASQWQPIETAPKTGEFVLIAGQYANGVWYTEESYRLPNGNFNCRRLEPPSHWLPIPGPPISASAPSADNFEQWRDTTAAKIADEITGREPPHCATCSCPHWTEAPGLTETSRECAHSPDGKHQTHDGGPDCRYCDGVATPQPAVTKNDDRAPFYRIELTQVVAALEGSAANTESDPRWLAAQELRRVSGWNSYANTLAIPKDQP